MILRADLKLSRGLHRKSYLLRQLFNLQGRWMQVWFDNLDCQVKQSCHLNENKHPQLSFHIGPYSNALVAYYMNVNGEYWIFKFQNLWIIFRLISPFVDIMPQRMHFSSMWNESIHFKNLTITMSFFICKCLLICFLKHTHVHTTLTESYIGLHVYTNKHVL